MTLLGRDVGVVSELIHYLPSFIG